MLPTVSAKLRERAFQGEPFFFFPFSFFLMAALKAGGSTQARDQTCTTAATQATTVTTKDT